MRITVTHECFIEKECASLSTRDFSIFSTANSQRQRINIGLYIKKNGTMKNPLQAIWSHPFFVHKEVQRLGGIFQHFWLSATTHAAQVALFDGILGTPLTLTVPKIRFLHPGGNQQIRFPIFRFFLLKLKVDSGQTKIKQLLISARVPRWQSFFSSWHGGFSKYVS